MSTSSPFSWLTAENRAYIRGVIEGRIPQWPNGPKLTQVDCWAHILENIPTLLIASTGWGKTSAFYGSLLVIKHMAQHPLEGAPKYPEKPVVLIVTPLVELGNGQAREMEELGIKALPINSETLYDAAERGRSLYDEVVKCKWEVVLIAPERLISKEFERVIRSSEVLKNLTLLGVDEAHLVDEWGKDFREAYHQIGTLRQRLPVRIPFVAVTATLGTGRKFDEVCAKLSLKPKKFHLIRLSSERKNIRTVIRELSHGLGGSQFPDIAWAFNPGLKTVVYCSSIELCFRVACYGFTFAPAGTNPLENVRVWDAITSRDYNQRTLTLFHDRPNTTTIVATVAFGLGMHVRIITDAINLGLPSTLEALVQQNGRAGRDLESPARGWTYAEKSVLDIVKADDLNAPGKGRGESLDASLALLLKAHVTANCLVASINSCLGNDEAVDGGEKSLKDCKTADRSYPCSVCDPEWDMDGITTPATVTQATTSSPSPVAPEELRIVLEGPILGDSTNQPVVAKPLIKEYRENATVWLADFAAQRWILKDTPEARSSPPSRIWTGLALTQVLDSFHLINTLGDMNRHFSAWKYLQDDGDALLSLIQRQNAVYRKRAADTRALANCRRRITKEKNQAESQKENIPSLESTTTKTPRRAVLGTRPLMDVDSNAATTPTALPPKKRPRKETRPQSKSK